MTALPTSLLADTPLPWRLTDSDRRRDAAADVKGDAAAVETALALLERCLDVSREPGIDGFWHDYWGFTADWLAEAMPELTDIRVETVAGLLRDQGPAAEELARQFAWWVVFDLGCALLAWLREAGRVSVDPGRFVELAARRWRGIDPWLAGELFRATVEIAGEAARPLLEAVERDPTGTDRARDAARNYARWIGLPSGCQA